MESELKKQLNLLKVNQRNDLKLPSKNADFSLLFDFRNSKKIEIDTFFELGYMGLIELAKTEEKLLEFIANIFSPFSKYYNRNMKTQEEIKEVDQNIESLIKLLNPYFLNQSCHKIIEFLIKIYQVNIYNSRLLLLTFLPFHESKIFIKLIQNINLENIKHFSFMSQSAKNGTMIPKEQVITELSKNYELFKEILDFYACNLENNYKFSAYSTFIFDLITKVLLSKEKTNENIITLIIKFLNSLFIYIKKKSTHDQNLPLIISGVCEILLCLLTKFDISAEYYCAIVNEYILTIVSKLYKLSNNLTRFSGSLIILFSVKNDIILSNEACKLLLSDCILKELQILSNDYDISPLLLTIIFNLSCCNENSSEYESNIQIFPTILKTLCKFNIESSKFVHICEKIIELLKCNQTSSFKNAILDIVRFIDEVKPELMNLAMINLDKGKNKEFLEKLKVNLFESLVKTKLLLIKDSEMNCLVSLMTGLTHSNNSVVIGSIKSFDKLLEDGNSQFNETLHWKFVFILKNKLKLSLEKENVLTEIFKMKNLNKLLVFNNDLNKEIKEFYIKITVDHKTFLKNYSSDLFNLIEKTVFELCILENQDQDNEILNLLILFVSLANNSNLNKIIEKNSLISKIIKFNLTANDYIESFASYLSSNINKKMCSKIFFENFTKLLDLSDNKKLVNLDILYNIIEKLLFHYKENLEFQSEEFTECLNILTEKLEKYYDILNSNDKIIEISIRSIPRLFDNFHVNKIRKNVLRVLFKLIKLARNFESTFEMIKKIHFHNYEGLFFSYVIIHSVITNQSDYISSLILMNLKNNINTSLDYILILALLTFLNSQNQSNENKRLIISILKELPSINQIKYNNINLLFNFTKLKNSEKELSCIETFKLIKIIVDNSREILFDKKYLNDYILSANLDMEVFNNFLEITEGFNSNTDFEILFTVANVFNPKKILNFSIIALDKYFSGITTNLPYKSNDKHFFSFVCGMIQNGLVNLTGLKEDDEKLKINDEFDFLSNLINNILLNIPNDKDISKEVVGNVVESVDHYDIQSLFKKNKNKNCFDLFYKILKICKIFNVNVLVFDFEIDYKSILKSFTTKLEKKELSLEEDELILSNFISLLNNHKSFKTEFLTQLTNLLLFVQDKDINHTTYFALKLHILLVINNLLIEFNKRKNESKYSNLNANFEKENIAKIKSFIFNNISELLNKCESVEDSETNLFNYLNVLNLSFEIVVRFSLNHNEKKKQNSNICIEILNETFKKMDEIRINIIKNKESLHVSEKFVTDINYLLIKSVNSLIFLVLNASKGDKNAESAKLYISEFVKYSLLYFYDNILLKDIFDCILSTIKTCNKDVFDSLLSTFITNVIFYNYQYCKRESIETSDPLYSNYQINYLVTLINELESERKISLIFLLISTNLKSTLSRKFFLYNFLEVIVLKKTLIKDLYSISKKESNLKDLDDSVNEKMIVNVINICFELYLHIKDIKSEITNETKELYSYYKQLLSFEEMLFICLEETDLIYYLLPYLLKFDMKKVNMNCVNYLLKKFFEATHLLTNDEVNKLNLAITFRSLIELMDKLKNNSFSENKKEEIIPQTIFSILTKIVKKEYFDSFSQKFNIFSHFYKANNTVIRFSCFVFVTKLFYIFDENLLEEFNAFMEEFISNISLERIGQQCELLDSIIECLLVLADKLGEFFSPFVGDLLKSLMCFVNEQNLNKLQIVFKKLSEKVIFDMNYEAISNSLNLALEGQNTIIKTKLVFYYLKNTLEKSDKIIIEGLLIDITKLFIKALQLNKDKNNITVILDAFGVFIRKMNPRQLEKSLEKMLSIAFKKEKESEIGYNLENSIIGYQLLNRILETAAQIFVVHLKKYINYSNEILTSIYLIYSQSNKSEIDNKKKSRQFFDDNADYYKDNSYLSLQALILNNFKLNFKYDKDVIMNDQIEEAIQPVCNQLKLFTIEESFYLKFFEDNIVNCIVEMMRSIKNDDILKRFNDTILELQREDHYLIKLLSLRTIKFLFIKMHEKYITLISDTIPYIMELLEDLNEKVSYEAGETIKTIEKLTGQNINEYIENNI